MERETDDDDEARERGRKLERKREKGRKQRRKTARARGSIGGASPSSKYRPAVRW